MKVMKRPDFGNMKVSQRAIWLKMDKIIVMRKIGDIKHEEKPSPKGPCSHSYFPVAGLAAVSLRLHAASLPKKKSWDRPAAAPFQLGMHV